MEKHKVAFNLKGFLIVRGKDEEEAKARGTQLLRRAGLKALKEGGVEFDIPTFDCLDPKVDHNKPGRWGDVNLVCGFSDRPCIRCGVNKEDIRVKTRDDKWRQFCKECLGMLVEHAISSGSITPGE